MTLQKILNPFALCTPLAADNTDLHYLHNDVFQRIFDKLSNGIQVDGLFTFGSPVIDV